MSQTSVGEMLEARFPSILFLAGGKTVSRKPNYVSGAVDDVSSSDIGNSNNSQILLVDGN